MEFFKIEKSKIDEDGRHLTITFETDGKTQAVEVNAFALESITAELGRLVDEARRIRGGSSGLVSAQSPDGYRAEPTKDLQFVILGLRMENGLEHNFAFDPQNAEVFQAQIRAAIDKCKSA